MHQIITGSILLERIQDFIHIGLEMFPNIFIHICHKNHGRRYETSGIQLAHHKTTIKICLNFSYKRYAYLDMTHRILFNLRKTSHCYTLLLKYLETSINTCTPYVIPSQEKTFMKSILWLCKPRIQWRITINLTVAHWTTR